MKVYLLLLFFLSVYCFDNGIEPFELSQVSLKKHFHGSKGKKFGVTIEKPARIESKETMERVLRSVAYTDDEIADVVNDRNFKKSDPEAYYEQIGVLWRKRQQVLNEANDAILNEAELMKDWLLTLETGDSKTCVEILTHMEDHVSDHDKAHDFVSVQGLSKLKEFLASRINFSEEENVEVLKKVFLTLGTASKYNPYIQDSIKSLDFFSTAKEVFNNCDSSLCNKVLYFLGGATRGNDENLGVLRELDMFTLLFDRLKSCDFEKSRDLKLAKRVTDLALDVTAENETAEFWETLGMSGDSVSEVCILLKVLFEDLIEASETCSKDREVDIYKVISNFNAVQSRCL